MLLIQYICGFKIQMLIWTRPYMLA